MGCMPAHRHIIIVPTGEPFVDGEPQNAEQRARQGYRPGYSPAKPSPANWGYANINAAGLS